MALCSMWLLFMLAICSCIDAFSNGDKDKLKLGLQAGQAIIKLLEKEEFAESLRKIGTSIGPYLGAFGPFVAFTMAFLPSSEPLKEIMAQIDNRFDQIENRLIDIQRELKWDIFNTDFVDIEHDILSTSAEYHNLYRSTRVGFGSAKSHFLQHYRQQFISTCSDLYNHIIGTHSQRGLATNLMNYVEYDRRKTQRFLMVVMRMLLQAVKLELSYRAITEQDVEYHELKWREKIQNVRKNFEKADNTCLEKYHDQLGKDIDKFAEDNRVKSNKQFVRGLFKMLATKYYWRDWLVVAYNELWGYDNHCVRVSGGYVKFRTQGRNFLVSSVDTNSSTMNLQRAENKMEIVSVSIRYPGSYMSPGGTVRRAAKNVFDDLDKSDARSVGVIKCHEGLWFTYHSGRFKYVNRCPYFNLFMWG